MAQMPMGNMPRMPQMGAQKPNDLEANRSMLNPTDMAGMASRGDVSQDMTVRDFFQKFGVDVDGPVSQLANFAKKQVENADPLNKMQNMARGNQGNMPPRGMPQGRPMPQGAPQGGSPLRDLASQMGG